MNMYVCIYMCIYLHIHHQRWSYYSIDAKKSFKGWKKLFVSMNLPHMHFEQMNP